jgi:hypothetical protein
MPPPDARRSLPKERSSPRPRHRARPWRPQRPPPGVRNRPRRAGRHRGGTAPADLRLDRCVRVSSQHHPSPHGASVEHGPRRASPLTVEDHAFRHAAQPLCKATATPLTATVTRRSRPRGPGSSPAPCSAPSSPPGQPGPTHPPGVGRRRVDSILVRVSFGSNHPTSEPFASGRNVAVRRSDQAARAFSWEGGSAP